MAEVIFNELPYDGFFLEFDDARSGDFSPLRHVPKGVRVVLGLVTSKSGTLERKDDLKRRIDEASRFVPPGKRVVLGLVTTKRPQLESKDHLKRRIDEASKFVPLDQLALSGQCGFSSTVEGNSLTRDEQIAKLALIVETAEEVWG